MNELREKPAPLDPLRTDTGGELSSSYLCMTNQINLVASVKALPQKYPAQLILMDLLMSRLSSEAKDFSLPALSHRSTDPGQGKDAWQCL